MRFYTLDETGKPVISTLRKWSEWVDQVEPSAVSWHDDVDGCTVHTEFAGFVHDKTNPPHLWVTKIIGGPLDQVQDRCPGTREDARAQHAAIIQRVRAHLPENNNNNIKTDNENEP